MRWKQWLSMLFLLPLSTFAATTEDFTLPNGLKVVVREDHRAPVVVTQVWYRVGSSYELFGQTGLSHALEHMMFKGTAKVPDAEFSRLVAKFGGEDNAFTTDNYTTYYQVYSSTRLPLALELEADRMANLNLKEDDFKQEIRVVMEERRQRTDDNPQSLALERFQSLAMLTNPLRNPTIGWMSDLQNMTIDNLRQWYRQWYAPNNATLVIVGDVTSAQVRPLVEKYFANLSSQPLPPSPILREQPELGEREMRLALPAKVPALYIGFNVPSLRSAATPKEAYTLYMLLGVLDQGLSARLETHLVREKRLAAAINSNYSLFDRGDTLMTFTAIPNEGHSLEEVRTALFAELDALKQATIAPEELQRVYAGLLASNIFRQDSISEQASQIGSLESLGLGWQTADQLEDNLKAVTADDIRQAAQRWLTPANRTTLYLQPTALNVGGNP